MWRVSNKAALIPSPPLSFYVTLTGWPLRSFASVLTPQHSVIKCRFFTTTSESPNQRANATKRWLPARRCIARVIALRSLGHFHTHWSISFLWPGPCYVIQTCQIHDSPVCWNHVCSPPLLTPMCWNHMCAPPLLTSGILFHFVFNLAEEMVAFQVLCSSMSIFHSFPP
jgi:hypothetical protein